MLGNTTDMASRVFAANRARGAVAFEVHASDGVTRRGDLHESGSLRVRFPSPEAEGLSAVFVNTAGIKALELPAQRVAAMFADGSLVAVSARPLVERALLGIVDRLQDRTPPHDLPPGIA